MALNDHAEIRLRGEHAREVEKLQGDLAAVKAQLVRVDDALAASEAEIKRLREQGHRHDATCPTCAVVQAEVERLRADWEAEVGAHETTKARLRDALAGK
jgi:4-hydroxy-3-methylbut-2-enyl diphosphate reductase IspH